ncbi:MAG: Rrf2 family transcriptional regulator [bacterium]|nr:Rrf2 family transcriptional regulator [bacterium]
MSTIIHISESTSLAFHSIAYIAAKNGAVKTNEISKMTGASEAHLSKVLQWLVKSGMIASTRGPQGGFILSKDPSKMTLYDIFIVMEGELDTKKCPLSRKKCPFNTCIFNGVVKKLNNEFIDYLKASTIESFLKRNKKGG